MPGLAVVVCVAFDHRADIDGLRDFKRCIVECESVEAVMECSGTYDLIVQLRCESFTDYAARLDGIADKVRLYISRLDANFVSNTIDCRRAPDDARQMWVPCAGGKRRIETSMIDKVLADGDYMSVHIGNWHCLVHDTMHNLREWLGDRFILLHRSALVRVDFIDRTLHTGRHWKVRLCDGTYQRVAKSHVADLLRLTGSESSMAGAQTPKTAPPTEDREPVNETPMRVSG